MTADRENGRQRVNYPNCYTTMRALSTISGYLYWVVKMKVLNLPTFIRQELMPQVRWGVAIRTGVVINALSFSSCGGSLVAVLSIFSLRTWRATQPNLSITGLPSTTIKLLSTLSPTNSTRYLSPHFPPLTTGIYS